ncbi:MAG: acylneuraminate cytidylyltransferase family protein [Alphaproteobacteria bacterium]
MSKPHCVVIVHARGGSKRIPLKNIKPLGGKPLIAWTLEAALGSLMLDRVIVSTDHDGIAEIAEKVGADVPWRRPADLSEDVASELVTQHGIEAHEKETGRTVDIAVTIQPTTPFLLPSDIDGAINLLLDNPEFDSTFTVGPTLERPEWMYRRQENGLLESMLGVVVQGETGVSQSLPKLYHPNGGAYATRRSTLFDDNLIIGNTPGGWVMPHIRSVDIDEPLDFLVAETIVANGLHRAD